MRELTDETRTSGRRMVWLTVAIVVLTAVLVGIGIVTLIVMITD